MPKQRVESIEFWYGTPDAPAPIGNLDVAELSLVVGTSSEIGAQAVEVRYRLLGESWQDLQREAIVNTQAGYLVHFRFPPLKSRARIEYEVLASIAGKGPKLIGPRQTFRVTPPPSAVGEPISRGGRVGVPGQAKTLKFGPERVVAAQPASFGPSSPPGSTFANVPPESAVRTPRVPLGEPRPGLAPPGPVLKAVRLAGLSMEVSRRIAEGVPEASLLDDAITRELISKGALDEAEAKKLAVAAVALDIGEGNDEAAAKIMTALETRGVGKPQDLAAMTTEEISSAIEQAGVMTPDVAKQKAANVKATISRAFATVTLMAKSPVARTSGVPTKKTAAPSTVKVNPEIIKRTWDRNANVDVLRLDLSRNSPDRSAVNVEGLTKAEKSAFFRDAQTRKLTLDIASQPELAGKLLAKFGAPVELATLSPQHISDAIDIPIGRATTIQNRALQSVGRQANGLFTIWDALRGGLSNIAVGNLRPGKVRESLDFFDGLDNLQELFGDLDHCHCEHCNSILGPAAYFVDLLYFIQTHVLDEVFEGTENHPLHLRVRRPDLWTLPLTCANTHTEIPQLQITTEIFENFIARKQGVATIGDRSSVLNAVYGTALQAGRHSLLQPFQLPLEELEIYLAHFGLRRSDMMMLLEEAEDAQLRSELGLSAVHADLITRADPSAPNIYNKLHLTLPGDGVLDMRDLLKATQVSRPELAEFLDTRFVAAGQPLTISAEKKSAESVQHDIERVRGVTLGHLDRLHRLLRLSMRIGWTPTELDAFLASTGRSDLDSDYIADLGRAVRLKRRFRASVEELCALAGDLPAFPVKYGDEQTPVDRLFNVPDLVRIDPLYPNGGTRFVLGGSSEAGGERSMRLRAGLRLDDGQLAAIVEGLYDAFEGGSGGSRSSLLSRLFATRIGRRPPLALPEPLPAPPAAGDAGGPPDTAPSFPMTGRNLSLLYRHAVLARWLRLEPTDLLALIRLTPGVGDDVTGLADVLAVVEYYDWWKSTPFTLEDLCVLLAPGEALTALVEELWAAIQAWLKEDSGLVVADTFLTQLKGVDEDLSRKLVGANLGTAFEAFDDGYRILPSWRESAALDLTALADSGVEPNAVVDLLRSYHPDERLPRALTASLRSEINLARAVVGAALVGHAEVTASAFLQPGTLPASLRGVLDGMLRLHRLGTSLRLAPVTLRFFAQNQSAFGVTNWSEPNHHALRRVADLQALIKTRFAREPEVALAEVKPCLDDTTALPQAAATLFGIDPALARDLASTLRLPENPISRLSKLGRYAETAIKLSLDAASLSSSVSEEYEQATKAARAVIAGFRAKYPEEATWREKVEPFEERVLEKKSRALIDYLLYGPGATFTDADEIYKYFLIDGQVDGCFRTSRVVAASSSLQLYAHRIRMNLEKEPDGGLQVDPSSIPDDEWAWRQHYRVWEANRKIFLWPENYLDPTIRDDKTPLFEELESELLQQEITEQTVVDAYAKYLRSLEELANLRFAGAYHHYLEDEETGDVVDILYLFGATGGEAPTHYWREVHNLARSQEDPLVSPQYAPWQKVDARIPIRHVTPVVQDGRLHVFWNEIKTTAQNAISDGKSRFIGYSHRYALMFTSLRLDGHWTPSERVSLFGSAPTFLESEDAIDDPLIEKLEFEQYIAAFFDSFSPWFGVYRDVDELDAARKKLLTPRFGTEPHTKAQEGYGPEGFMWERPYVSLDPIYGHRLLLNCAGLLVRGPVDLFDRRVMSADDTLHQQSPWVGTGLFARRRGPLRDVGVLRRDESALRQATWPTCYFDYPVAAEIALHDHDLAVLRRHVVTAGFGLVQQLNIGIPTWPDNQPVVLNVGLDAGIWSVPGTASEVVIETEDDLLLLQPHPTSNSKYLLHRIGTTLVRDVARRLFTDGVNGLLSIEHQLSLKEAVPDVSGPRTIDLTARTQNPIANESPYGIYFQEIFQHIPLLLAHHLNANGKFEEAQRWYHYVFDPTSGESVRSTGAPATDRNWKYRQFRGQEQAKLRDVLSDTAAIQKYREDPFNAHAIARLRVSAYQKAVVMRYIDNLLDWADDRFTRFQMESVNEAMMLYVTAAEVLGPRPLRLGECGELSDTTRTYEKLKDSIGRSGEFLLEVEELIPKPTLPSGGLTGGYKGTFGLGALVAIQQQKASVGGSGGLTVAKAAGTAVADTSKASSTAGGSATAAKSAGAAGILMAGSTGSGSAKNLAGEANSVLKGPTAYAIAGAGKSFMAATSAGSLGTAPKGVTYTLAAGTGTDSKIAGVEFTSGLTADGGVAFKGPGFTPMAVALEWTPSLVQSFGLRQKFQFLGDHWKRRGARPAVSTMGDRFGRAVARQATAAFCIPRNELLDQYWDRVEDRIRKIRTCRDITGLKRKLSLFAPPIDPMLLARARALGLALDDVLGAFEGMIPAYRFPYLLEKAKAFTATVESFGSALQAALERKDGEELFLLQTGHQQQILALTTKARKWELDVAQANLEAAQARLTATENRRTHYAALLAEGLNDWEVAQSISTHTVSVIRGGASIAYFIAGALGLVPQLGSPFAMKYGGAELKEFPHNLAAGMATLADVASAMATSAALEAGWDRRDEDWKFQRDQAADQLRELRQQIAAAEISRDLAEHALKLHEKSIEQNEELREHHEEKFSGLGLYTWLSSQLQRTYREAYTMAYRMARYAEQAYRFEREDYESDILSGGYWEPARAGLLAGQRLLLELQQMDQRYIETDIPKRNVTDHCFSLRQWDPAALIELRQKGECSFKVPELFFDLSSPGDYRRRIRSARVTIPAVAGPYVNVMATLTLDRSEIRTSPTSDPQEAPRPRVDSITTSSARNDAGVFELNFHGERYVPFEGAGAVSKWSLSLPTAVRMFDYKTISDIVLHFDYAASFDGSHRDVVQGITSGLVASVRERLADEGIPRVFSLREEFWEAFQRLGAGDGADIEVSESHLPFFMRGAEISEASLVLTSRGEDGFNTADVMFDGQSLGAPAQDERFQGVSIALPGTGATPWRHTLKLAGLSQESEAYLVVRLRTR